jgi:hypothetical protein
VEVRSEQPFGNGHSYKSQIVDLGQSRSWGTDYQLRSTYTSTLLVILNRENNSVGGRNVKDTIT